MVTRPIVSPPILSDLQQVILSGWPDSKGQVPPNAQEFWNYPDELTVAQGLIVKGQKIVYQVV